MKLSSSERSRWNMTQITPSDGSRPGGVRADAIFPDAYVKLCAIRCCSGGFMGHGR